jgi:CspA family cold shock protein
VTARVIWWNCDRGHGFIRTESGEDVFLHHTAIVDGRQAAHRWRDEINPGRGQLVEFDPAAGTVGTVAANVRIL